MRFPPCCSLAVFLAICTLNLCCGADGLVKNIPPAGRWASYDVTTSIGHADSSVTNTKGVLVVRALASVEIEGTNCRWLEFELSWEQPGVAEQEPPRFHSWVAKLAVDEEAFPHRFDPDTAILRGVTAKTSSDRPQKKWKYEHPQLVEKGRGSASGLGAVDFYLRAPFRQMQELGMREVNVGGMALKCSGLEASETTHRLGLNRQRATTVAYRQWASQETPFGVVEYHFEKLNMDGTFFNQHLVLLDSGDDAVSALTAEE